MALADLLMSKGLDKDKITSKSQEDKANELVNEKVISCKDRKELAEAITEYKK